MQGLHEPALGIVLAQQVSMAEATQKGLPPEGLAAIKSQTGSVKYYA